VLCTELRPTRGWSCRACAGGPRPPTLVELPSAAFLMGDESDWAYPGDGEGPVHEVVVGAYAIDRYAVTNTAFAAFVHETGHESDAERFGWSFVFAGLLPNDFPDTRAVVGAEWWRQVFGANWRHPEGPKSTLRGRRNHPVVHVSWGDAQAYCAWSGTRLPTEAEWEYAARAGTRLPFPWGDELEPGGAHRMNVFQGRFPSHNTCADGFAGTAPVDAFAPNLFGLYNMTGNVWEWCADWYAADSYERGPRRDPQGPAHGTHRIMRGGSYLCHESYCRRYRVSARQGSEPASSTGNVGFRVAADVVRTGSQTRTPQPSP
jgi:formylglycine-generating enzyme